MNDKREPNPRRQRAGRGLLGRGSVIASPYLWLLFFFLVPFAIVLKISVAEVQLAIPPYTPLFAWPEGGSLELFAVGDNYLLLIEDSPLHPGLCQQPEDRGDLDRARAAGGLPHRLCHGPRTPAPGRRPL